MTLIGDETGEAELSMENLSEASMVVDAEPAGFRQVPVSLAERWAKLAWRMGIAGAVTAWLFYLQFHDNASGPYMLWGFAISALGTFLGVRAFGIRERRIFDSTEVHYTRAQRLKRAAPWFLIGLAMLAIIWTVQYGSDQFSTYWWYAWPALLPLAVSAGLYLLRSERVLSKSGQLARARLDAAKTEVLRQRQTRLEAIAGSGLVRYGGAAVCVYVAYWFLTDAPGKNNGWAALAFVVFAMVLARELGILLLGLGVACVAGWALFSGIAALPVSVAVIVGALIIASAVGKR